MTGNWISAARVGKGIALLLWTVSAHPLNAAETGSGDLVVISPHNESIRQEFGLAFSDWHLKTHGSRVKIEWRDVGGSSEALRFIQSEFGKKPNGIGVDSFFGGGQEPYVLLAQKGLLEIVDLPTELLQPIPAKLHGLDLYDPGHRWYGAAISSFGILQNLRVQSQLGLPQIHRWSDLADPRLKGWVGAGDPRNSGTMMVMFEGILQFNGWDQGWRVLTQMAGNARKFDRVSTTTAKDVTIGETAYGLAIDFYGFSQVAYAGKTNLTFIIPEDFATLAPDPIAILKGAPNLKLAQRWLHFALGEPGQKLWFFPRGHPEGARLNSIERLPIRSDLYQRYPQGSNIGSSPFARSQTFQYNGKLARDRREVLPALLGALLIDTHAELQAAWQAVLARGTKPQEVEELGRPPLTEPELMALAQGNWKSNSYRLPLKVTWQRWAQEKYRGLADRR
ncbi:MAG: ABC transporter substrate-binding protein [Verrucomicrobiales bacterium]|nr:ABC transporter substrate-binding protein [Verrucomicrobiales bacterium]